MVQGIEDTAPADGLPTEAELERVATRVTVRRAPRYRAFAVAGVLAGVVVGSVLVLATARGGEATGAVLLFVVLGLALVGAIAGGLLAVLADRRSRPDRPSRRSRR